MKFAASLDSLANGRQDRGIRELINARLGLKDDEPIWPNGPTVKQSVNKLYKEGRSRTIHGTSDKLERDWTGTKELGEQLAKYCLVACIHWAASHPACDDPALLSHTSPSNC